MDLESLKEVFVTGAIGSIALVVLPLLMEVVQFVDTKMDSWSLNDTVGNDEYRVSYFNIVALILSLLVSVVVSIISSVGVLECLAGGLLIYGTEYASGKLFWSKLVTLLIHIKNKVFAFSDVTDVVDAMLDDFKVEETTDKGTEEVAKNDTTSDSE